MLDAHYSAPESQPLDQRWTQMPCEVNRYCEAGVAYTCGRQFCWPTPLAASAREGRAGELSALGFALQPGISIGDVIEIQFDVNTNQPPLPSTAALMRLVRFSVPFGDDGLTFKAEWSDPSLLKLTIMTPSSSDPLFTKIGALHFTISAEGNLRCGSGLTLI